MTTITATVIADSISENGKRLTTLHLRYPRFVHAEFLTHRVFSRNARSSRAVPIAKMIEEIKTDPVVPLHWGAAQKGMQADQECEMMVGLHSPEFGLTEDYDRETAWLAARDMAVMVAEGFAEAGYHKQVANRLLEPFMHIDTLVSASEWDNFFALRIHRDAEPHIRMLAEEIRRAMADSTVRVLKPGEWHLPYIDHVDWSIGWSRHGMNERAALEELAKLSVARCARISYVPFDGNSDIDSELRRYEILRMSGHWSPFEHQATPDETFAIRSVGSHQYVNPRDHGNFVGWRQHRRIVEREVRL